MKLPCVVRIAPTRAFFWCVSACLAGTAAVAQPTMVLLEDWDGYAPGTADLVYDQNWVALPGADRYEILQPPGGEIPNVNSAPSCLRIPKARTLGITRDLLPELELSVPGATEIIGTTEDKLVVTVIADLNRGGSATADIFVEISKGDVHVDRTSGTAKDVIAFGMTNGFFGPSSSPWVFDGLEWIPAPQIIAGDRFNEFSLAISDEEMVLTGGRRASGTVTIPRNYLGGFDRISIRTVQIPDSGKRCTSDDLRIEGGEILGSGPTEVRFKRGDGDATDKLDLSDAISTLSYLFLAGAPPRCFDAADVDDSGKLDITDAIYSLTFQFLGGPRPAIPFPDCGIDEVADELDCGEYPPCNP